MFFQILPIHMMDHYYYRQKKQDLDILDFSYVFWSQVLSKPVKSLCYKQELKIYSLCTFKNTDIIIHFLRNISKEKRYLNESNATFFRKHSRQ